MTNKRQELIWSLHMYFHFLYVYFVALNALSFYIVSDLLLMLFIFCNGYHMCTFFTWF